MFNMEQASFTTEYMNDTVVMVNAMKHANTQMKKQFKQINIDSVEVGYRVIFDNSNKHIRICMTIWLN